MNEEQVKNAVIVKLGEIGCKVIKLKSQREHGVDITARYKYPKYFLIEVKGDAPKTAKSQNSGREVRFIQALGQILTRAKISAGYNHGLAFPISFKSKVYKRIPYEVAKVLKLHIFLVYASGKVDVVKWKDLKNAQSNK